MLVPVFSISHMELLYVINVLLGIMGFTLATAIVFNQKRLHALEEKFANLHTIYAKREDVESDFAEIKATLLRIENKLDGKQDK